MATRYAVATGNWNNNNTWASSSGGAPGASFPVAGDDVVFDAASGAITVTVNVSSACQNITMTGYTGTLTGSSALAISGTVILPTGGTFSYTGTATFGATAGTKTITSNGKTWGGAIVFDGVGGTFQLSDNLVCSSTITLTNGTFDANNKNLTCTTFNSSNANTRTITMGSGTWTLTGTGTVWNTATTTNLTLTAGTSTVVVTDASSSSKTLDLGGKTLKNVTLSGAGTGSYTIQGTNSTISGTLRVSNTGGATVTVAGSTGITVGTFDCTGATITWAGGNPITFTTGLTLATGVTVTHNAQVSFSTTGGDIDLAGKSLLVTVEIVSGTWTLQNDFAISDVAYPLILTAGFFDANDFNVTVGVFSSSNTNARTLRMGKGTWTLGGTNTVWDYTTVTNLTHLREASTVVINSASGTAKTFETGGKSFWNIEITATSAAVRFTNATNTFNKFRAYCPGTGVTTLSFAENSTTTANVWEIVGSSLAVTILQLISGSNFFYLQQNNENAFVVMRYVSVSHCSATGYAGSSNYWFAPNSTNGGSNSGITFSEPTVVYPRIAYNSKWVNFPYNIFDTQPNNVPHSILANNAAAGVTETLNLSADVVVTLAWRWFENATASHATLKRKLRQWVQWAQQGLPWTVGLDIGEFVLTTLSVAGAVGDVTLTLTTTAGIVAGRLYMLRSDTQAQVVKVNSISSATIVVIDDSLDFDFAVGSRFRSDQFWPGRLTNKNPITERPPLHFDLAMEFLEDVNDL